MTGTATGGHDSQSPGKCSRGERCAGTAEVNKDKQAEHARRRGHHVQECKIMKQTCREPYRVRWTKCVEGSLELQATLTAF